MLCVLKHVSGCQLMFEYSQFLQKFKFTLDLSGSVSVVAKSVNKDLKQKHDDSQDVSCSIYASVLLWYLYMLPILQLGLVLPVLVLQSVFFTFDEVFIVSTVTVQSLGVQVDNICYHRIEEVSVMGDN